MRPIASAAALAVAAVLGPGTAGPATAQDAGAATPPPESPPETPSASAEASDAELRDAARRYIESDGVQRMMDGMFSPDMMASMMQAQTAGRIPPEEMARLGDIVADVLGDARPAMEEAMVEATVETFTLPEIEAQIAFYTSPEGAAVMAKMQPFMAAFNEAAAPAMQSVQEDLATRIAEAIQPQE